LTFENDELLNLTYNVIETVETAVMAAAKATLSG